MPSHADVIDDLRRKCEEAPELREQLFAAVVDIYDCIEPDEVLKKRPQLQEASVGLEMGKLLKIIKWLFIEQDLTYWLQTGRNMLMSAIESKVFGMKVKLKG